MVHHTAHCDSTHRSVRPVLIKLGTVAAIVALIVASPLAANAAEPGTDDFLGTADSYAIIADSTITNTGDTVVTGDVALQPGPEQQLEVGQVSGEINVNNPASLAANNDLNTAYVILANTLATEVVGTANLAARPIPYIAGVYNSASDLLLDGTITLSGDADDVFIFQAATGKLDVLDGSVVLLIGGVQACNVYWQVGSSATLFTGSQFVGSILAASSIAAQNSAQITGQLLAGATLEGAVTLENNVVDRGAPCVRTAAVPPVVPPVTPPAELAATGFDNAPAMGAAALLALTGSAAIMFSRRSRVARAHG